MSDLDTVVLDIPGEELYLMTREIDCEISYQLKLESDVICLLVVCDRLACLFWLLVGMTMNRNLISTSVIPRFVDIP